MEIDQSILENIEIASPCSANWDEMTGDERVKFCGLCSKNVYNLSSLSRKEAENLVIEKEGKICVRFYKRSDGTMLTDDCPVGLRIARAGLRRVGKLAAAVSAAVLSIMPSWAQNKETSKDKPADSGNAARPLMGAPRPTMGEMVALPGESPDEPWMNAYKKTMVKKIMEKLPKDWKPDSPQVLVLMDRSGKVNTVFSTKCSADQKVAGSLNEIIRSIKYAEFPKECKLSNAVLKLTISKE